MKLAALDTKNVRFPLALLSEEPYNGDRKGAGALEEEFYRGQVDKRRTDMGEELTAQMCIRDSSIPALLFIAMAVTATGWDNLGYIFLAIFTGFMLLMCGIGWGIWWMIHRKKQNKTQRR